MKHPMPAERKGQKQKVSNSYSAVILSFPYYQIVNPARIYNISPPWLNINQVFNFYDKLLISLLYTFIVGRSFLNRIDHFINI